MLKIKDFSFAKLKKDAVNWAIVDFDNNILRTKFQEWTLEELNFIE